MLPWPPAPVHSSSIHRRPPPNWARSRCTCPATPPAAPKPTNHKAHLRRRVEYSADVASIFCRRDRNILRVGTRDWPLTPSMSMALGSRSWA
eukprot:1719268-Pyramimonas_sp.AAC.1